MSGERASSLLTPSCEVDQRGFTSWSLSRSGNWSDSRDLETVSLKILLVGSSGVGKTSLLLRFCDNHFAQAFVSTVGVDFRTKTLRRGERRVKLQVWDTAGQERYRSIAKQCFRGAAGFLICYDLTRRETFENVRSWCANVKENSSDLSQIMIIATKLDLADEQRAVSTHEGAAFASDLGLPFLETSAKDNEGIMAAFDSLTDRILNVFDEPGGSQIGVQVVQPNKKLLDGSSKTDSDCSC